MMKTISKFALFVLIGAILYLLFSGNLISRSPWVIAAQLLAVTLSIWARRNFRAGQFSIFAEPREGPLMMTGPYRFVRHPMYAAALLLIWASALGHFSAITLTIAIIVTMEVIIRITTEEEFLRARFPGYVEYSLRTKRLIPFVV